MPSGYEGILAFMASNNNIIGRASSRLLVSNLDFGVDDRDMRELFSSFGSLIECRVLYERSGRSTGTAEITFTNVSDARKAKAEYHKVPLDGREMVSLNLRYTPGKYTFRTSCLSTEDRTLSVLVVILTFLS